MAGLSDTLGSPWQVGHPLPYAHSSIPDKPAVAVVVEGAAGVPQDGTGRAQVGSGRNRRSQILQRREGRR
jgi:hypothetical protein